MRILVLSDSHGNVDNMARAVELTAPDRVRSLGTAAGLTPAGAVPGAAHGGRAGQL